MTVSITWAQEQNGAALTSFDIGKAPNGTATTIQTLYISHNGLLQ